jgi:hypothetical protein
MPDPLIEGPESERVVPIDRPPIFAELGFHDYQESEYEQGAGHCDKCGGGPEAPIHHKARVDPLERIAAALETIVIKRDDWESESHPIDYVFAVFEGGERYPDMPASMVATLSFESGMKLAHAKSNESGKRWSVVPLKVEGAP